jgi:hypothetical protein
MRVKCALCGKDLIRKDTKPLNHFCSAFHQYIFKLKLQEAFHQFNIENEEKKG